MGLKLRPPQIRPAKELTEIINMVRARYMLEGKKAPSITKITKVMGIILKQDKQRLINETLIRF